MNSVTVILIYFLLVDAQTVCTAVSSTTQSSSFRSGGQNEGLNTVMTCLYFEKFPFYFHIYLFIYLLILFLILFTVVSEILL